MNKNLRVTIPTPCHEGWEKMTPAEKGRYCSSCQKVVMDFTSMSDAQIIAYFKKENRSTCGHFHRDQLNRDLHPVRKRLPWVRYFFQIAIPAFLFSYRAVAQGTPKVVVQDSILPVDVKIRGRVASEEVRKISGQVQDTKGQPVPFASVIWTGTNRGVQADAEGRFEIQKKENDRRLTFSCVGFTTQTITITEKNSYQVQLVMMETTMDGVVVIYSPRPKLPKQVPLLKRIFSDSASVSFQIYPNPVTSGSPITVDWKKEEGEYTWELTDVAGRIITRGRVVVANKVRSFSISLPSAPHGTYVLTFLGRKGKAYSQKIIIK